MFRCADYKEQCLIEGCTRPWVPMEDANLLRQDLFQMVGCIVFHSSLQTLGVGLGGEAKLLSHKMHIITPCKMYN